MQLAWKYTKYVFCHHDEIIKHLLFNANSAGLYGQSYMKILTCIHQVVLQRIRQMVT
jgi:hypothetical protein